MAVVDELVTLLSFKMGAGSEQAIKTLKDGITSIKGEVTKWAAAATAAGTATAYFITSASESAVDLQKLSQQTNMSTDSLQKWMYAAESVGASANAVTSDLSNMLKSMSSPIPGELNMELMMLGVSVRNASGQLRGADEVIKDVGERLNKMGNAEAIQWAERVGISNDTLMLLKQGKQGLAELFEEAQLVGAIIPEDAIERGAELSKSLNTLKRVFSTMGQSIALSFAPNLKKVVDNFKSFIISNGDFIRQGLGTVIEGIGKGFNKFLQALIKLKDLIVSAAAPLKPFIKDLDGVKVVSGLVAGALGGLTLLLAPMIAKFALIGSAISAVSLIIEDFIVWINGGKSVIGDLINAFNNLDPVLKEIAEAVGVAVTAFAGFTTLKAIIPSIMAMTTALGAQLAVAGKLAAAIAAIAAAYEGAKWIGGKIAEFFQDDYEGKGAFEQMKSGKLKPTVKPLPPDYLEEKNQKQVKPLPIDEKQLETLKLMVTSAPKAETNQVYQTTPVPASMTTNNTNNNANSTVNNNQTITIMTGADSRSVIQAMQTAMPDANVVSSGTYGSFIGGY